jgi:uracil-DNA glycosylase
MKITIEQSWKEILKDEFEKEYFVELTNKVHEAYLSPSLQVFPPEPLMFNAFNHCHFNDVKVVIIGQDPYHGAGQAHGLSFSVPEGVPIPPSLRNIYKEIESNSPVNWTIPVSGNLVHWADQGVLLLNSVLTVEEGNPNSHRGCGWEQFTDAVIQKISDKKEHVVFLLWGAYAQEKGKNIDTTKHLVLTAPHPSPLSAYRGFFGCEHFGKTNKYLQQHHLKQINW